MKVLGICCSPRKGGNTESLVKEALRGADLEGAETDYFSVSGKHIEP
jgi:multimeric flavodoxin WrbA